MTELLKHPQEIRNIVNKGIKLRVMFRGVHIFTITPPEKASQSRKLANRPTFKLNSPDTISKRDIYEKLGN